MSLQEELGRISSNLKSQRDNIKYEQQTKAVSIDPFIRALGYDKANLDEVQEEYQIHNMDAVDYAILRDGMPIIFIEAKKTTETLGYKWWKQLSAYFNADDACLGILTNGIKYKFYADFDKPNVMDREPFLVIDMLDLDESAVETLDGFAKSRFDPQASLREWRIRRLVESEFAQPGDDFVRLFAKQVHHGTLRKEVVDEYRPVVKRVLDAFVGRASTGSESEVKNALNAGAEPFKTYGDITRVPIFAIHHGHRFEAKLHVDDVMNWHKKVIIIEFEGKRMAHTDATRTAVRKLNPEAKTQPSSLRFWRFIHPVSGDELPIQVICDDVSDGGSLRQQLAALGEQGARPVAPSTAIEEDREPIEQSAKPAADSNISEIPVFKLYKGHRFDATLLFDTANPNRSLVRFAGKKLKPSPSTLEAINTVNPEHTTPASGWFFWKIIDPQGNKRRDIVDLRTDEALVRRMGVN